MSKTLCILHIVFATKRREMTITEEYKRELYAYIYGILKNNNCFVYRINGIPNHIHLLIDLSPTISVSNLVKDIKLATNNWIKQNNDKFPYFTCWGEGYYAASISIAELESCKNYIMNQEQHHLKSNLMNEMEDMAKKYGFDWYEKDWS